MAAFCFASAVSAKEEHVQVSLIADTDAIEPGKPFRLGALFKIDPQWHIYWHTPGEIGLPTEIHWELPEGFTAGPLQWPEPKRIETAGIVNIGYESEVLIFASVTPTTNLESDKKYKLSAKTNWLVCKLDGQCIPGEMEIELSLSAGKAAASAFSSLFDHYAETVPRETPISTPVATTATPPKEQGIKATEQGQVFSFLKEKKESKAEKSTIGFLVFAFLGGLLLNIMPCVLPVLSIKILSFVRQSGEEPKRVFRLGLVFALGVFASFAALASVVVAVQGAGTQIGWGFQFQEPRFVILMCAIVFAFGLSLFGVFTVELPGTAIEGVEGLQRREGAAGAFFNGVLATALATPCTAPLLAPALGFAFAQPPLVIYLFFLAIAGGLASPYVLLTAKPGWLKFMPKPGAWMDVFKQIMGFLLMATVVWLLSVVGGQIGSEGIIQTLAFLTVVGLACWLLGLGFDLRATNKKRLTFAASASALILVSYLYFPERFLRVKEKPGIDARQTVSIADGKIQWQSFSVDLVEKLAAENKTVFVDFTADWCLTCKVNEKAVLATQAIQDALAKYNVITLKADYTNRSPEITRVLHQFGRSGVPLYVVFPAGRPGEPIVLPDGLLTVSMVVNRLAEASEKKPTSSKP